MNVAYLELLLAHALLVQARHRDRIPQCSYLCYGLIPATAGEGVMSPPDDEYDSGKHSESERIEASPQNSP